jgi:DNA-binding MarR family transcriptional regulator
VRRAYDQRLAGLDLNLSEASLLRFVGLEGTLSQRELAERLHIGRAATGKFIDQLESRRLVRRIQDHSDRRVWRITLTAAGVKLAKAFDGTHGDIIGQLRNGLDLAQQKQLAKLLGTMRANAEAIGDESPTNS